MRTIVGLCGYARAGKDTAGHILVDHFGFQRVSFADKLREVALAIDPYVGIGDRWELQRLSEAVRRLGWEKAKVNPEVRRLLQVIGTDAGRNILGSDVWVDAAFNGLPPEGRFVFTDVRFPNESKAIFAMGGTVYRITRPGCGPINNHPSETALDHIAFPEIANDGTIDDLHSLIAHFPRVKENA